MLLLRRIATGVVAAAALAVLVLSVYLLWNARQWDYLPLNSSYTSDLDARAQLFQDKLDIYSHRVNDMENLVIILLGITGLYTIIFIVTADLNARSMRRQVDRAIQRMQEQMNAAMDDRAKSKQEAIEAQEAESKRIAEQLAQSQKQWSEMMEEVRARMQGPVSTDGETVRELERIGHRIEESAATAAEDQQRELAHYEAALPALELIHGRLFASQIGGIYRALAHFYAAREPGKSRFYLSRAVALAPQDYAAANELGALVMNGMASPDYGQAKQYFEASLGAKPDQQRAKYGLALIAKADGNFEAAQSLLESALKSTNWESGPDAASSAEVHYALACVMARRGQQATPGNRAQYFLRATEELRAAFAQPSPKLDELLPRDTEEGGDLFVLANTLPYANAIDDLLLNVRVGVA